MTKIRILPHNLVNQIAAGEIIERPASIIKELVENAIDAGADHIQVWLKNGGKSLISVKDNGIGVQKDELELCLSRYATSKLPNDNLVNINTLGFRGEALASIASVSKISIASKHINSDEGFIISAQNGEISKILPNSIRNGTLVNVQDLFFFVPARLKFLKTDTAENIHCYKIFKKLAISNPNIQFQLFNNNKMIFNYPSIADMNMKNTSNDDVINSRIYQILGSGFKVNSLQIKEESSVLKINGLISIPTFSNNQSNNQFIVVNGRALNDRFLFGCIKAAYQSLLPIGQHPLFCLFININNQDIDINVTPNKSEIRFSDPKLIRHILVESIKSTLSSTQQQRTSNLLSEKLVNKSQATLTTLTTEDVPPFMVKEDKTQFSYKPYQGQPKRTSYTYNQGATKQNTVPTMKATSIKTEDPHFPQSNSFPLGEAKAQLNKNWLISETSEGLIIVDQHAAHERINHELLNTKLNEGKAYAQNILIDFEINMEQELLEALSLAQEELEKLGISFSIANDKIIIKAIPSILASVDPKLILYEIAQDLLKIEQTDSLDARLQSRIASMACKSSIKSGDKLSIHEIHTLLRTMEKTKNYAQCSHGRPTFIKMKWADLEKLFGRS